MNAADKIAATTRRLRETRAEIERASAAPRLVTRVRGHYGYRTSPRSAPGGARPRQGYALWTGSTGGARSP